MTDVVRWLRALERRQEEKPWAGELENVFGLAAAEIERLRHALLDCSAASGIPDRGDALRAVIKTAADALAAKEG